MRKAGIAAAVLSVAGVLCASGAVEWQVPKRGANREFVRILSEQTGTNSVKKAGPDTLVFHFDTNDAFVASLKLDFETLHPYGYYLAKRGNDIALVGRSGAGKAYACMDFLKRYTGYRSFGNHALGEVVPKVDRLDLPAAFTIREEPSVASVCIAGDEGCSGAFARSLRVTCISTHAMSDMVSEKDFEAHPEYFPEVGGVRKNPKAGPWNPCMSNPALPDLFRAYATAYFKKHPMNVGLPMGVNDGGGDCCCAKCRALLEKHGNQYVEFYNMGARILKKEFPGKLLAFIAYNSCSRPPQDDFEMEDNILVEKTGHAGALLAWRKKGIRHFGNYQYLYALNDCRMAPACYSHVIADYLRDYHKTFGLATFYQESYPDCMLFDAGRQYVVNELLWNMDADVDALLDDYHGKMFGPAAKPMRRFSDVCEEAFKDNPERGKCNFFAEWMNPVQFNGYTFERLAAADAALAEAAKLVKRGSREARCISLMRKLWSVMRPLMDCWQCGRALLDPKLTDADEILRLAKRGLDDIEAYKATYLSPADESEAFISQKPGVYRKWKSQTESNFAPLPPLEFGIDAAFARLAEKLGREKAQAFFTALAKEGPLVPYAVTRLYLADHEPENIVVNGSFEETCEPVRAPTDDKDWNPLGATGGWVWWRFPNTESKVFVDDTEAHTGKRCAALTLNRYGVGLMNRLPATPLTRYRMSCWVKFAEGRGNVTGDVSVRLKNAAGEWIDVGGSAIETQIPAEAIGKWTEIKFIFTTPDSDTGLFIVPVFSPKGSQPEGHRFWVDDVRIERLCEVPRTLPPQAAFARETVAGWTAKWGARLPQLVLDKTLSPVGAYRAEKTADGIVIRGDAEGLRIGLYAWARACGIRWFSPGEDPVVPEKAEDPADGFYGLHAPSFPYRGLHVCGAPGHFDPKVAHWMSFMGMNRRLDTLDAALAGAAKFGKYGLVSDTTVHSFDTIIPAKRYFEKNPDFFSLLGGKRTATGSQRCLANPKFRKTFVSELKRWIACEPNVSPVGICPNDGFGWCECKDCKALDTEEDVRLGRVDGRVADFVKYVCAALPKATIGNYCYSNFSNFYRHLDPMPTNLVVSTTAFHCQAHGLGDESCKANAGTRKRIRDLRAKGVRLYLYDYYTYRWDALPAPMWKAVGEDFRFLAEAGADGFVCEAANATAGSWTSFWPAFYTAATMLLDAKTDVDRLVDDWCAHRYGEAADEMRGYFREWEKAFAGGRCWTKEPDDFLWVMRPEPGKFLEAAVGKAPKNAAVLRAKAQFDGWLRLLEKRRKYPCVREVEVGGTLAKLPVHVVDTTTQIADEENPTEIWMALADGKVKIRVVARETKMKSLVMSDDVYNGDNVEIFFADGQDDKLCYHFLVAPDGRVDAVESKGTRWNWNWEHHAETKVTKSSGDWTVDMTVPLSDLKVTDGSVRFTVARNRHAGGSWESTGAPAGGAFFKIVDYITAKRK